MTTSIRMNGSKNKADTRSIHLLVRLFSVPKSSHAISPFIFIRLGQLLLSSCGFRTHLYSPQSGNCIALANVLQKASLQTPSLFGKIGSSRGNVPYLDIICTTLRLCNIVGEGGKASLSSTSYPIQPTRLLSEQLKRQRASVGTQNLAADKGLVHQSINQSIIKCIHAHPVTKYFSRITQYT